jgi:hypothetical protein
MAEEKTAKEAIAEQQKNIEKVTKRGFDLKARLEGRGLRRGSITLYLDEEKGVELGDAYDVRNQLGGFIRRERTGVIGDLDLAREERENLIAANEKRNEEAIQVMRNASMAEAEIERASAELPQADTSEIDATIAEIEAKRDEMVAELEKTGLVIQLRAVPPVIQKDCHRKAKATLEITEKKVPADKEDEFKASELAHLLSVVIQSITDIESDTVNDDVTYEDAKALMDFLPPSQWARLDAKLYEVQFTDAISRSIESQEDFS